MEEQSRFHPRAAAPWPTYGAATAAPGPTGHCLTQDELIGQGAQKKGECVGGCREAGRALARRARLSRWFLHLATVFEHTLSPCSLATVYKAFDDELGLEVGCLG